jgi:hypothetical protein
MIVPTCSPSSALETLPANQAVDDLDLLLVLGVGHELQHHAVDRQRRQVHREQFAGADPREELGLAVAGGRGVGGIDAVDVLDVDRPCRAVRVGDEEGARVSPA